MSRVLYDGIVDLLAVRVYLSTAIRGHRPLKTRPIVATGSGRGVWPLGVRQSCSLNTPFEWRC
jgi:hypothetical protein